MTNTIYALFVIAMLYAVMHTAASGIDREHCQANGMAYGGTTLMLEGYCVQGTIRIPAAMVGAE